MTRRTALLSAGALTVVLLAAVAAVAANLGLLSLAGDNGPVGRLGPADLAPTAVVERSATGGTSGAAGGNGASGSELGDEPAGREWSGEDLGAGGDGSAVPSGTGVQRHEQEQFQGRGDDD